MARTCFVWDPFKYARSLLEEKKSGKLQTTKQELEQHIKDQLSDNLRAKPLGSPGYVPHLPEPSTEFDTSPPRWSEVQQVIERARAASAPGPNGVPYKVLKNCPGLPKALWRRMVAAWKTQSIPPSWCKEVTTFIPKEKDSQNFSQFRGIALLNVEGKIVFSILARRMTSYLLVNKYVNTSCQKAGVPGFPGCMEHSATVWEQIQTANRSKEDLHVVWLDLANAFGSVPHQLITYTLEFFYVPSHIQNLVANYFNNQHVCYTTRDISTDWHQLEKGKAMGCSISPILFTVAFEILLWKTDGARGQISNRPKIPSHTVLYGRHHYPPLNSSLHSQTVDGERIPLLAEEPVRSVGRLYTADLSDMNMASAVKTQLQDGLHKIDQCPLPGKFKVWCYQFTLYHHLM